MHEPFDGDRLSEDDLALRGAYDDPEDGTTVWDAR